MVCQRLQIRTTYSHHISNAESNKFIIYAKLDFVVQIVAVRLLFFVDLSTFAKRI